MVPAAHHLPDVGETPEQLAYRAQRLAHRAEVDELSAAGAFHAPEHLRPGLQGGLDQGFMAALPADPVAAEAA